MTAFSKQIASVVGGEDYEVSIRFRSRSVLSDRLVIEAAAPALMVVDAAASADVADDLTLGVGSNCIIDGQFRAASGYWSQAATAGAVDAETGFAGGTRSRIVTGAGMSAGAFLTQFNVSPHLLSCAEGDRIEASAYVGGVSLDLCLVRIVWYTSAGGYVSEVDLVTPFSPAGFDASGDLTTYIRAGGFATAPATAGNAAILVYYRVTGATAAARLALPYIGRASAEQNELTPWNRGMESEPGADVTGANVAAGITGQGALATLSQVNLGASGRVYREDGSTHVADADVITSLGEAATIAGQGALATKDSVDLATSEVTNKSLANLDAAADSAIVKLNAGTHYAGGLGAPATNGALHVVSDATWESVCFVEIAVPTRRLVRFPDVQITFDGAGAATTAGLRIIESPSGSSSGADVKWSGTQLLSISDPQIWRAPLEWRRDSILPSQDNQTRRYTLQVQRATGSGSVIVQIGNALISATVF